VLVLLCNNSRTAFRGVDRRGEAESRIAQVHQEPLHAGEEPGKDTSPSQEETEEDARCVNLERIPGVTPASSTTTTVSRHILPVTVPRKFGSDLSTIRFANTVEPRVAEVVLQCGLYHLSVSAMQTAYHLNTSLFHCQADSLPPRDMHLLREEGRGMDSASSI